MTDILLAIIAGLLVGVLLLQLSPPQPNDRDAVLVMFIGALIVTIFSGGIVYAIAYGVQLILRHVGVL
jgi:hypothetical protein